MGISSRLKNYSRHAALLGFALWGISNDLPRCTAQRPDRSQQAIVDRFLEVLKRRPRAGTALDRIYGHHVQNGTLDPFIDSLSAAEDDGVQMMILGLIQSSRGKPALAAEAFAKAEDLLPQDAACSFYLGRSLLAIGQTENAAKAMQRAIDRKPPRSEALPIFTELGRIYGRAGQSQKALAVWQQLEALFPGDVRVGGQIARTLAEEGNVQEALQRFEKLAKSARKDDDKIAFSVQASEMKRRLGKQTEATELLEEILTRLRPGSWLYSDVRNRIENGYLKSGDYDALAEYYRKKLAEAPDDLALTIRLGRVLVSAGRLEDARETLQQATRRAPDDAEVRLALIDVLVKTGQMGPAAKQYERLVEKDPENPDYLLRWGQMTLADKAIQLDQRRSTAAEIWQRLADARGDDPVTLSQIADRLRGIDRTDDAIALYRQAIQSDPDSPQYREYLGEYLNQLGRQSEAIDAWNSIAQGERRGRDSLVRLAEVLGTFKKEELALKAWRDASTFDLSFAQELRFAKKLRDSKLFDEAIRRLDTAAKMAETPDEQEQLLRDRIATYSGAGTLSAQIERLKSQAQSVGNLRTLALMHSAAGQLTDASVAINEALKLKPKDSDILLVAADIAERQNRFLDAAELFEKLSSVDQRFRGNHLQRVASLRIRLGQVDRAFEVCESIIDANPASPDSYQFYARMAFRMGRNDEGVTALRRAMTVAPRDNQARKMLAAHFSSRYRTDEAIELYWQAMRYCQEPDQRISLIKSLAPLYDRKTEMETLVTRIKQLEDADGSPRATGLMIAAAHEAVDDFGAARQAIDPLLINQPRDVSLLETMVRLCDQADEVVLAAEYQDRVVDLADTPENRFKLVQLQLEGDLIDLKTALSERISLASDPSRLGSMIQSFIRRQDYQTAKVLCDAACERDESLWDVKLTAAQLMLLDRQVEEKDLAQHHQKIGELADQVLQVRASVDSPAPTASTRNRTLAGSPSSIQNVGPNHWYRSGYGLARAHRLGQFGNINYSYSSHYAVIQPGSYGHARVLAGAVKLISAMRLYDGDTSELRDRMLILVDQMVPIPDPQAVEDAALIHEHNALRGLVQSYLTESGKSVRSEDAKKSDAEKRKALEWKLAELDPVYGAEPLTSRLMGRIRNSVRKSQTPDSKNNKSSPDPLTEDQLDLLVRLWESEQSRLKSQPNATISRKMLTLHSILEHEFTLAGQMEQAANYAIKDPEADATLGELINTMAFFLQQGKTERADALVDRLLPAVRADDSGQSVSGGSSGIIGSIARAPNGAEFIERHRFKLFDAALAQTIKSNQKLKRQRSQLSDGTLRAYVTTSSGSRYSSRIKGPLSPALLSQEMVDQLGDMIPPTDGTSRNFQVPDEFIEHLDQPVNDVPVYEQKARRVMAAFAHWWNKQPEGCYRRLISLCEDFDDDVDLQIERARLASELNQPAVALELLDSFDPLDSGMLVRKEMAAMNLAALTGNVPRAKQAAERLFGMRMSTSTQLALVDQMRRLDLKDKADAILQRLRGGKSQSESTMLQIARSFASNDDQAAAAEVAYSLLRRLGSGRTRGNNYDYYHREAVSILQAADKLDPLIQRAKRRLSASPNSARMQADLAELYAAAGENEEADKLWSQLAGNKKSDPRQLMARAKSLTEAGKHKEGALMYLEALQKDPSVMQNRYHEMTSAVRRANIPDQMFQQLLKVNPSDIPYYRIDELLRIGDQIQYSKAKRDFVEHLLKAPEATANVFQYLKNIPEPLRNQIPSAYRSAMNSICQGRAFEPESNCWDIFSRSSSGEATGPLDLMLGYLIRNEKPRERYLTALKKVRAGDNDARKPTAKLMQAVLDLSDDEKREAAFDVIEQLAENTRNEQKRAQINSDLLWQVGQILERSVGIDDRPELLVVVYQAARQRPSSNRSQFQYTVGIKLVEAYRKNQQFSKARQLLLDAYQNVDNSEQNQWNPGYGDYQDIQSITAIAGAMKKAHCPIDALVLLNGLISNPERFERASRWGGGLKIEKIVEQAEKTKTEVTSESAIEYLNYQLEELGSTDQELALNLWELPLEMMFEGDVQSGLQIAIDRANQSEDGKALLKRFHQSLRELSEKRTDDWSLPAAEVLVAHTLGPDSLETPLSAQVERLVGRLPEREVITAAVGKPEARKHQRLLALCPLAVAITQADSETASKSTDSLIGYLNFVATALGQTSVRLAFASATGNDATVGELLRSIENDAKPGAVLSLSQVNTCLRLAGSAAKSNDLATASKAMQMALGSGPPLQTVALASGGDAFAINPTQNQIQNRQERTERGGLTEHVLKTLDLYTHATGIQLAKERPKDADSPKIDQQVWREIVRCWSTIVMPDHQPRAVYPYAKRNVSRTNYDNFSSDSALQPLSLTFALGKASVQAGQLGAVMDELRQRFDRSADKPAVATAMMEVARGSEDAAAISDALNLFEQAMRDILPPEDTEDPKAQPLQSISSQLQQQSWNKSDQLDLVIRAIWPLASEENWQKFSREHDRIAKLLNRTGHLIASDSYTSQRHQFVREAIEGIVMRHASQSDDGELFQTMLGQLFQSIESKYASYQFDSEEDRARSLEYVKRTILVKHLNADTFLHCASAIRQLSPIVPIASYRSGGGTSTIVCMLAAEVEPEKRYPFLKEIVLGDAGQNSKQGSPSSTQDKAVVSLPSVVTYQTPPRIVRSQIPMFDRLTKFSDFVSEDIPITDPFLILVDTAAELGRNRKLAREFSKLKSSEHDDAAIAAAIALLGSEDLSNQERQDINQTLQAVAEHLRVTSPQKNDENLVFPSLAFYLGLRCAGQPEFDRPTIGLLLFQLYDFARKSKNNPMVSLVSRVYAKAGYGPGANTKFGSPLKHFVAVAIPKSYRSSSDAMAPRYRFDDRGTLVSSGGSDMSVLILKYPLAGEFEFSFRANRHGWGESSPTFGGAFYHSARANQSALIYALGRHGQVKFPLLELIQKDQSIVKTLRVGQGKTVIGCNGQPFATDFAENSYPWVGIGHWLQANSLTDQIKLSGDPQIPRSINLIHPTMRGWSWFVTGPDPLLPNRENALKAREQAARKPKPAKWWVNPQGELEFTPSGDSNVFDGGGRFEYLRPLLDGERIEMSVWWEWGESEVHPGIGHLEVLLRKDGIQPSWQPRFADFSRLQLGQPLPYYPWNFDSASNTDADQNTESLIKKDPQIKNLDWNTIVMTRAGDFVDLEVNGNPLWRIPVTGQSFPSISRAIGSRAKVRSITLSGNWPETLPKDLWERKP